MQQSQFQRVILWVVFGLSLVLLWDKWQAHNGQPSMFAPKTEQAQANQPAQAGTPATPAADASVPSAGTPAASAAGAPSLPAGDAASSGKTINLANDVLSLDVDLQGGQIVRGELLAHKDLERNDAAMTLLQNQPGSLYAAQMGWVGAGQGGAFPNHRSTFAVTKQPSAWSADRDSNSITLEAESGGLKVVRVLTLRRGDYVVDVKDTVTNVGAAPLTPTLYMQLTRDNFKPAGESHFYSTYTGPVIYTDKSKFHKIEFSAIDKGNAQFDRSADNGWIGIIQHYFVVAWVPGGQIAREYYADKVDANRYRVGSKEVLAAIAPGASATTESRLLIAPQDQQLLEKVAPGLDLTVDYGWLTVIAKPIYSLLAWLHGLVGNWGWAIVLLTIIIKTIFFPLQAASYKSMARMKAVTPRLQQIRERFGGDRVKMNQAMMELYKTEKINPLGGCLPIVVQIPVFIALYWVLLASVEMRNAPWILWIKDLAAPDPYFILPLVMAVTMFLQTKLNPTPPDPVQAKMMLFMPLAFSVMFFFFPSGLVLYWLVNNIYSIVQQWVITRKITGTAHKPA